MRIVYITPVYPSLTNPNRGIFVYRMIDEWRRQGVEVYVIAPQRLGIIRHRNRFAIDGELFDAQRPLHFVLSKVMAEGTAIRAVADYFCMRACEKYVKRKKPDVIVGKFLLTGGIFAAKIGRKYSIPSVIDAGDSVNLTTLRWGHQKRIKETLKTVAGIYCVSSRIRDQIRNIYGYSRQIAVFQNTAPDYFTKLEKKTCRDNLNLSSDKKIILFVGQFIERKGPDRIVKALRYLPSCFHAVFIGEGGMKLGGERVLRSSPCPNEELPLWMNAADVFCMPTRNEGCSNAVAEAMACGMKMVVSDTLDMKEQVRDYPAIFIDQEDPVAIAKGILQAQEMSLNGVERKKISIQERSQSIFNFIKRCT